MAELNVLAIHGCCLGDKSPQSISGSIAALTEKALGRAGIDARVSAPFYGDLLLAYAEGEEERFLRGGLEASDVDGLGGGRDDFDSMFRQIAYELSASAALEARLPVPDKVRELAMYSFMKDVATYLTMIRAKDAIWDLVEEAWHAAGPGGPDLVIAHSLGTVVMFDLMARRMKKLNEPKGLLMMGSPLYLDAVKNNVGAKWDIKLKVGKWIHIYDDGDLIAGGRPISETYTSADDRQVENKAFPTSHDYAGYIYAATRNNLFRELREEE